jgi:pSer/pThr/pTyr-binding forkhead associated (FHA) protein
VTVTLEITQGLAAGRSFELRGDGFSIGRRAGNDVVLEEAHVSGDHCRVAREGDRVVVTDLGSTNGTTRVRRDDRVRMSAESPTADLESGDVIELGSGDAVTTLRVTIADEGEDSHVLTMTKLDAMPSVSRREADPNVLSKLYAAQKRIGLATDLEHVLEAVAESALELLPSATHVTIVLSDDDQPKNESSAFVPVLTRVRAPDGSVARSTAPIPIARSVYRKVVKERAAVLAADAPRDVGRERVADGRVDPQHARGAAVARARRSSACSRRTTATRPACSRRPTSSCSSCSRRTRRSRSRTRG